MHVYLLGALLFIIALIIFVFQNTAMVTVHFLNWTSPDISLAVVALIAACAGALVTFLLDCIRYFKVLKRIKELTNINKKLEKEIKNIKSENKMQLSKEKKVETTPVENSKGSSLEV